LFDYLLISKTRVFHKFSLDSDGRILACYRKTNIGTGEELGAGKDSTKTGRKDNDTNDGVGGRITEPNLLDGMWLYGKIRADETTSRSNSVEQCGVEWSGGGRKIFICMRWPIER
jgi:hypothetical protein